MGYDRISALPDSLITEILLYLPTKDSVKTSILSTRWRTLWLDVPGLDLNSNDFDCFSKVGTNNFGNRFLEFNRECGLQKFKMKCMKQCAHLTQISEWVATAVDHCRIQNLDVSFHDTSYFIGSLPANIYNCKTLVSLKLQFVKAPKNPEFVVSLPCLKIMYLEDISDNIKGPSFTEKLLSSCPVLEDLNVLRSQYDYLGYLRTMRVRSQTLKIFRLTFHPREDSTDYAVEIDAPRLKYMSFADSQSHRIVLKNLNSLVKIDIDTEFNVSRREIDTEFNVSGREYSELEVFRQKDVIREFLTGICNVKHMIISHPTLEVLGRYSKLGSIPKFHNLSHLQAVFSRSSLPLLPVFLESCSNLKNLILDFSVSIEPKQKINLTNVPQCLISTLERVEIKNLNLWKGTGIKLASYILMNALVLKKLNLNDSRMTNQEIDFYKSLFTLIKRSSKCQVFFDDMQLVMLGR